MSRALSQNAKITSALDYADGSADRNGATLDMKGFDGVLVVVHFATIATSAVTTIKMQQGEESDLSDAADLEGTGQSVADDDDNEHYYIDLYQPTDRYVRVVVDKNAVNNSAESATYIQYRGTYNPTTHATGVTGEFHLTPAEGTA
jgi:hypothetical protein